MTILGGRPRRQEGMNRAPSFVTVFLDQWKEGQRSQRVSSKLGRGSGGSRALARRSRAVKESSRRRVDGRTDSPGSGQGGRGYSNRDLTPT
jgi:hypothetical protein